MSPESLISYYDYELPPELIAQFPAEQRDASRLLVVNRKSESITHHQFRDLPQLLAEGDLLVMNNTRVVPARLFGIRSATGGKWEGLFLKEEPSGRWRIIGKTRGTLKPGERITLVPAKSTGISSPSSQAATARPQIDLLLEEKLDGGEWIVHPQTDLPAVPVLEQFGTIPLPHYMQRETAQTDWERYQTTYAQRPGAVAAPTAGLHFTDNILKECQDRSIGAAYVTLHVGLGTFRPVNVDHLQDHKMHHEWCELPGSTVRAINETRQHQGRVIAVGTTSVRTLESVAIRGPLTEWSGSTDLFIRPPFQFQVVDAMITNFHLPKSTLLVLVSTFAGRDLILRAYQEAIRERYRFFSYGDAMLIL